MYKPALHRVGLFFCLDFGAQPIKYSYSKYSIKYSYVSTVKSIVSFQQLNVLNLKFVKKFYLFGILKLY